MPETLAELNWHALALSFCTIVAVLLEWQVPVIGEIPTGLPELNLPHFSLAQWSLIFTLGLTLALPGTIDSLLTSLVADSITRTRHKSNKELIGQGLDILDYRLLKRIAGTPKPEIIIMLSVFALTVFVDLVIAVGVGVVLAIGLVTWRMAKTAHIHLIKC